MSHAPSPREESTHLDGNRVFARGGRIARSDVIAPGARPDEVELLRREALRHRVARAARAIEALVASGDTEAALRSLAALGDGPREFASLVGPVEHLVAAGLAEDDGSRAWLTPFGREMWMGLRAILQ